MPLNPGGATPTIRTGWLLKRQPPLEDIGRAPIFPLPKVVTEHGDRRTTALIVGRGERSPKKRVHPERAEKSPLTQLVLALRTSPPPARLSRMGL